jgi:hypothetical protein
MENPEKMSAFDKMKAELEELEVQLKLGSMDMKTHFEAQKAKLRTAMAEAETWMDGLDDKGADAVREAREELHELAAILDADFDFSYSEHDRPEQKVSDALNRLEEKMAALYQQADDKAEELDAKLKEGLERFRHTIDFQQAYFRKKAEKAEEGVDEWKKELLSEVEETKQKLEKGWEEAEEKIDNFKTEISSAFDHIKKAFK